MDTSTTTQKARGAAQLVLLAIFAILAVLAVDSSRVSNDERRQERVEFCSDAANGETWRVHRVARSGKWVWFCTITPDTGLPTQVQIP